MNTESNRFRIWTPLLFSLVLTLGMILGFNLRDTLRNKQNITSVIEHNPNLEEIIDLIKDKYVDTVNTDLLRKDAISGILQRLDPHTVYIPADELQNVNDDLEGSFFGIGVEFSIVRDTIAVISVIENGPAYHAGVEIGDQLIKVGDTTVAGRNITSDGIIHLLKGKRHSLVYVTFKRSSDGQLKQLPIVRDAIPIYSVDAGIMLDSITGFIKINRFSATTYDEFSRVMKVLVADGARQFVIDLRENPGGYLDAATSIADEFLDDNKLIVYTKGLHSPKVEYKAGERGAFEKDRLIVLVDENSASASEILAGAVQDWDRGVIIGRRTFGKGLVQEQYDLDGGGALRLTVAKYYTPSGRCIQRSFSNGKEAYEEDFEKRFESGALTRKDTMNVADTTHYYTSNHRAVYGGGGITPDIYVPYDTTHFSTALLSVVFSEELKNTVWDYFIHNRKRLDFKDIKSFDISFADENNIAKAYFSSLKIPEHEKISLLLSKPGNMDYFKVHIKAQLARLLFRDNGYYSIITKHDNVIDSASHVLYSNEYSKIISR